MVYGLVPNIMHDILEGLNMCIYMYVKLTVLFSILLGTLVVCIKHLLIHYITVEKIFSLQQLNQRIHEFNFGTESKNRPSDIATHHLTPSGELKQSG